jgi:hypothetical protein
MKTSEYLIEKKIERIESLMAESLEIGSEVLSRLNFVIGDLIKDAYWLGRLDNGEVPDK